MVATIRELLMTTITRDSNVSNRKSRGKIEELFSDFASIFRDDNYDFLYNKDIKETMEEGESGIW